MDKLFVSEIRDCKDIALAGFTSSGVYNITVPGRTNSVQVYCDLNTDGGGWLVSRNYLKF